MTDGSQAQAYPFLLPALHRHTHERRFCVWLFTVPPGKRKPTKVPFGAGGLAASSTDPRTWLAIDEAVTLWHDVGSPTGARGGIGIFLGGGLAGIDFDSCIGAEGLTGWALDVLEGLRDEIACAEVSPSGTGVKAYLHYRDAEAEAIRQALGFGERWGGKLWKPGGNAPHGPGIEMYLGGRFFALTGDALAC
jgi:primase-polymerase (primpol)-like protein